MDRGAPDQARSPSGNGHLALVHANTGGGIERSGNPPRSKYLLLPVPPTFRFRFARREADRRPMHRPLQTSKRRRGWPSYLGPWCPPGRRLTQGVNDWNVRPLFGPSEHRLRGNRNGWCSSGRRSEPTNGPVPQHRLSVPRLGGQNRGRKRRWTQSDSCLNSYAVSTLARQSQLAVSTIFVGVCENSW
jgi:hypothetical protein